MIREAITPPNNPKTEYISENARKGLKKVRWDLSDEKIRSGSKTGTEDDFVRVEEPQFVEARTSRFKSPNSNSIVYINSTKNLDSIKRQPVIRSSISSNLSSGSKSKRK